MPSSLSFSLYNSSQSLSKHVSKTNNNDNDILEHPEDYEIKSIEDDDTNHQHSVYLTRQIATFDKNWIQKKLRNDKHSIEGDSYDATMLFKAEQDEQRSSDSHRCQIFSPNRSRSVNMVDSKQQSRSVRLFSFNDQQKNNKSLLKSNHIPLQLNRTRSNLTSSPVQIPVASTNIEPRKSISKIPIRSKSLSLNAAVDKRKTQTSSPPTINFAIINNSTKPFTSKARSSSVIHTKSVSIDRKRLTSSDDDDDVFDTPNLKQKLKEEKRQSKKATEILNKLHENYEELLEKFAQAENTIDHLRFQPKTNKTTKRSNGTNGSSASSQGPPSSSLASGIKSMSSGNSGTLESVFYDEHTSHKCIKRDSCIPETVKLDLLIRTKALGDNMKSFLTLMDTNQVSIVEQKQMYENIKQDYEQLMKTFVQKKENGDLENIDLDADLNKELETMKDLLKEIAIRLTGNLYGKPTKNPLVDRPILLTRDDSLSSQSARSSLCNHNDLMEQYKKLLNALNSGTTDNKHRMKSVINDLETNLLQTKTISPLSTSPDLFADQTSIENKLKPYLYTSTTSEDDYHQQQQSKNIPSKVLTTDNETTSLGVNCVPSTSVEHHQIFIEKDTHKYDHPKSIEKRNVAIKFEDNKFEIVTNTEQQETTHDLEYSKPSSPLPLTDRTRPSTSSSRTRVNDHDSGVGTNTITKITSDSKHCASPMDESHFQSLDEGQESISSSTRSTGSDSERLFSKCIKRFSSPSTCPRRSSRQSDSYISDIEPHMIDSSDSIPKRSSSMNKKIRQSSHTWKPQRTSSPHRSRLSLFHQGQSIESTDIEPNQMRVSRPLQIQSRKNISRDSEQQQQIIPRRRRSSIHINQTLTPKQSQEQTASNKLYLDPKKGVIYQLEAPKVQSPTRVNIQLPTQKDLHRCSACGSVVTYHRCCLINSKLRRAASQVDDPGYESGHKKRSRSCRYIDYLSSSESDSDLHLRYHEMIALNEAYNHAEKVENCSQRLAQYITRQLKLALSIV